jgi:hypothetical protein
VDKVRFRLEVESLGIGAVPTVNPYVNGVHLRDLAQSVELPPATADDQPDLAGNYAGLRADLGICWPSRHFLGKPQVTCFRDGDTVLLGCICGDAGCWPLAADIKVDNHTVTWRRFRTGHRSWDLSRLGPFRFNRNAYISALQETYRP